MASHRTQVEIGRSIPMELDAGAAIMLKINVSCTAGCDLSGGPVRVMAADEILITSELATFGEAINETIELALKAPGQIGAHTWTILFPRYESEGVVHEECSLVVCFTTRPHAASMAVWDVPSPVIMNHSFKVKVGVKCSAACLLAGQLVEVCDESGTRIAESRLGHTPWPDTDALYVTEIELAAPSMEGMSSWSARFSAYGPGLPHEEASAGFNFRTARPPEHRVTVKVMEKETAAPLENVEVRLGIYRASTDAYGLASVGVPKGVYNLDAWKAGYEMLPRVVEVGKDLMIQVQALLHPERDPDDEKVWM